MSGFSDDGQWWWDGTNWVATNQVVLPDLPKTAFEQSGRLQENRARAKTVQHLSWAQSFSFLTTIAAVPMLVMLPSLMRNQREWRFEQLALATAYLLGPDEPMVAAEVGTLAVFPEDYPVGGVAVAVTAAHVMVFRIDDKSDQPRWIVAARRAADINIEFQNRLNGLAPGLTVSEGQSQWTIRGVPGLLKPQPVLDAWRQARTPAAMTNPSGPK